MTQAPEHSTADSTWEYAPAPERTPVEIADEYGLFIGGAFVGPKSGRTFETANPATEETLARVAEAGDEDVDAAVTAAAAAQPKWSRLKPAARAKYLFRIARRIQERARELAILETMDGGKPIRESRDIDLPLVAQHFFYHAGWCDKLEYAFPGAGPRGPRPVGVCAQVIPWNFPLLMAAWKLAPALACGNTCVLKPAETTPLTALRLAEIFREVDLPPGVVNILTGAGATGRTLVRHPGIDKVAFTGSTEIGKDIALACAERERPLTLELGGKSPHIIFEDASIDQAVEGTVTGIYFNQGHTCCAGSRLFVEEPVLDEVVEKLRHRMSFLRLGDPLDKNTDIGAINSRMQLEKIRDYVRRGRDEGAELHEVSGTRGVPERGYWCPPCFFSGVQPSHAIARDEIFGPVLAVMSFRTPAEAVERANNTRYGLAAGVWTNKGAKMFEVARSLQAGVVWCNTYHQFDAASPFGGYKESGFGREGGPAGLRPYLKIDMHLPVPKTYKLFINGAFPRTESGRTEKVTAPDGAIVAHVCRASRKDLREAVEAARGAFRAWADRTAYNRGQILYRMAEMLDGRRSEFAGALVATGAVSTKGAARREVEATVDRLVAFAGWTDKIAPVLGGTNPVNGPYYNISTPEPTGVVAVVVPDEPALLGLVTLLAPPLCAGNTVVVVAGVRHPLPAVLLGEICATSDIPKGVVNILTAHRGELLGPLADHRDVDAIGAANLANGESQELRRGTAENLKRVRIEQFEAKAWLDRRTCEAPWRIEPFVEVKTLWHPSAI